MKKIIYSLTILSLGLFPSLLPATTISTQEDEIISPLPTDTIHFVMTVKWGNVQGEVQDKTETNFDGSISVSSAAKVSLIRTLLFEKHNEAADKIISPSDNPTFAEEKQVAWNSLIYGHWDGVRVRISSPANDNIIISTTQGSVTKTAQELYEADEPIVQDVGNGKEIWIKTHSAPRHSFIMKLIWGKTDRDEYAATVRCAADENTISIEARTRCLNFLKENFSGSLTLSDGAKMKLVRTLRFENNDSITSQSESNISWDSTIWGGVDGVLVKFVLDRNVTNDATVTLSFPQQSYSKSISLLELYHERIIKDQVKSGYGIYASIWSFADRKLIRAKNDYKVYMMEDGLKRHIPNPRVFEDQGLDWNDVEEVEDDEVEVLPESDALSYTEGTLIQGDGPEVYAISNDQKRHITNPQIFTNLQYNWRNIIKVDNAELALYSTDQPITETSDYPDSTLVRAENESTVYLVEGDKLKPISSPQAFESNNFRWNRIKTITSTVKNKYQISNALELGNGALVRDSSGKIYTIDQGKKRWIRTGNDFDQAGFKWEKIVDVSTQEINSLTEGEDVVSDDVK